MSPQHPAPEALLARLEWSVIRRLDGRFRGDYRSVLRGRGLDLADLREYQMHDDVRHIDWNVTARLQTPHVRQFRDERDVTAWFAVDVSSSTRMGSTGRSKHRVMLEFVACVGRLLQRQGNPLSATRYNRRSETLGPARNRRQDLLHLLAWLNAPECAQPEGAVTDLSALLDAVDRILGRRSLVFVLSDFISTADWRPALGRLALRHEVVALRVFDPLEVDLPETGLVVLEDAETGEQLEVDAADPAFRQRFAEAARERVEEWRRAVTRSGADTIELSTADDLTSTLLRFLERRRRYRHGRPAAHRAAPAAAPAAARAAALARQA